MWRLRGWVPVIVFGMVASIGAGARAGCPAADPSEALANAGPLAETGLVDAALECYQMAAGSSVSAEVYEATVAIGGIEERRGRPWQAVRALEIAFHEGSPADRRVLERRIRRLAILAVRTAPGLSVDERCAAAETLLKHGPTAEEKAVVRDAAPAACGLAPKPAPATTTPSLPTVSVDQDRHEGGTGVGYDIAGGVLIGLSVVSFGLATWFWAGEMGDAIDARDDALDSFTLATELAEANTWADEAWSQDQAASDANAHGWISAGVGAGLALTGLIVLVLSPDDPDEVSAVGASMPALAVTPVTSVDFLGSRLMVTF